MVSNFMECGVVVTGTRPFERTLRYHFVEYCWTFTRFLAVNRMTRKVEIQFSNDAASYPSTKETSTTSSRKCTKPKLRYVS